LTNDTTDIFLSVYCLFVLLVISALAGMLGLCLFITGCATCEPAQKDYVGATAKLADSVASDGGENYSRLIPAQEATFHIVGRTHCAAPIIEIANTVYLNVSTGKQVGNKLLVKASTALNRGALLLFGPAVAKSSKQQVEEIPPN
jgi:hypothetical protein